MSRVIHGQNNLLTPFELGAHNIRVYGGRSTYQNGNLDDPVNHPIYVDMNHDRLNLKVVF